MRGLQTLTDSLQAIAPVLQGRVSSVGKSSGLKIRVSPVRFWPRPPVFIPQIVKFYYQSRHL